MNVFSLHPAGQYLATPHGLQRRPARSAGGGIFVGAGMLGAGTPVARYFCDPSGIGDKACARTGGRTTDGNPTQHPKHREGGRPGCRTNPPGVCRRGIVRNRVAGKTCLVVERSAERGSPCTVGTPARTASL